MDGQGRSGRIQPVPRGVVVSSLLLQLRGQQAGLSGRSRAGKALNEARNPDPVFVSDQFGKAKVRGGSDCRLQITLQTFRKPRGRVRQGQMQGNEVVFLIGWHQQPWFGGG